MTDGSSPSPAEIPTSGRVLAVDLGEVRIGLAVSDALQTIGSPAETLDVERDAPVDDVAVLLAEEVDAREVVGVVVGYPKTLEGREGAAARRARLLAEALQRRTGVPVDLWDERFTTTEAERAMIDGGVRRRDRRKSIDTVAASLILRGWLEARRLRSRS